MDFTTLFVDVDDCWKNFEKIYAGHLIETVNDMLKNVCQIEHSRHRSPINFLAHLFAGLIAYTRLPKKPSLKRDYADPSQDTFCLMA